MRKESIKTIRLVFIWEANYSLTLFSRRARKPAQIAYTYHQIFLFLLELYKHQTFLWNTGEISLPFFICALAQSLLFINQLEIIFFFVRTISPHAGFFLLLLPLVALCTRHDSLRSSNPDRFAQVTSWYSSLFNANHLSQHGMIDESFVEEKYFD